MTELKSSYSARAVAAMTGLSARQLQWWDARRLFAPHVAPRRTSAGGYTERRYTPVDLLELMVLADLRRQGVSVAQLRLLLEALRRQFNIRLYEALGADGPVMLLTDGRDVFGRTPAGELFNLVRDPLQPLLVISEHVKLRNVTVRGKRKKRRGR